MKSTSPAYFVSSSAYDQRLGQFLSADPLVQDPTNSQNYNRYAYCFNNPLKYTDPSGYRASNGNNNYLNDNDPSKTFDPFETSNVRIWAQQIENFRNYMTNYKNNEVLVGVTESVFSESDGTYYAFSSGFYIGKYDGKLVFTTKISDLQNINIWYNNTNGQYYYSALMDIGDHSNDYSTDGMPICETISYSELAPEQDFSGFWGGLKYIWTGGNVDGYKYNSDGIATGRSPNMGIVPTPSLSKLKLDQIFKLGKVLRENNIKGLTPKTVLRVDTRIKTDPFGRPCHDQLPHIHLKDGRALNLNGTWKHGQGEISSELNDYINEFINTFFY